VDDRSNDDSLAVALRWVQSHAARFNRVILLRNRANSGLARTRNTGFDAAETPYVLVLDADNRLLPECAAACLRTAQDTGAAFAYPVIRKFGAFQRASAPTSSARLDSSDAALGSGHGGVQADACWRSLRASLPLFAAVMIAFAGFSIWF
jgi:glycosyltransferase involved in cell wall biosynthesis